MNFKYSKEAFERIRRNYDQFGEAEWERLDKTPKDKVQFFIHNHYLHQYIKSGDKVLEIGPGPGRFTIELAKLGAKIYEIDISEVQLKLNEEKLKSFGFEDSVIWRKIMDVADLSELSDNEFDAVVCYGGPISYVFDKAPHAISELIRVTKSKGYIFISVMSLLGTCQFFLEPVLRIATEHGPELIDDLIKYGNVVGKLVGPESPNHICHMFTWSELKDVLDQFNCEIVEASAANYLSNTREDVLERFFADPVLWKKFLHWELELCKQVGAIDAGTHMLTVIKKL